MTFFEKPAVVEKPWRAELPAHVQRTLEGDPYRCNKCGAKEDIGTNEDEKVFCLTCWSRGGCGFAWWRL